MAATAGNGKSLGLAACTAVVVGNMVGSGFYLSPSAVAPYGWLAIAMWIVILDNSICRSHFWSDIVSEKRRTRSG